MTICNSDFLHGDLARDLLLEDVGKLLLLLETGVLDDLVNRSFQYGRYKSKLEIF